MAQPPTLRYKGNPNVGSNVDYDLVAPLNKFGSDYPCKNSLSLLGTAEAKSVASWEAGGTYQITIEGGARHNGGSCQASLSFDQGRTFYVIRSYVGNCPPDEESILEFTLPSDTPESEEAIFSWSWFNKTGNREMYMNCAVVTISNSSPADTFFSRPQIFTANIGNGCSTAAGKDLVFPDPGQDVDDQGSDTALPEGSCAVASDPAGQDPSPTHWLHSTTEALVEASGLSADMTDPGETPVEVPADSSETPVELPTKPFKDTMPGAFPTGGSTSTGAHNSTISALPALYAFPPGTECVPEGLWNCISGTAFQRCASGTWSVVMSMAAGTRCDPGVSESFGEGRIG